MRRVMTGTSNNAHRKAVMFAESERPISVGGRLVVGLLSGTRVSASVPGVDDHITIVHVVFVASGEDYRFGSLPLVSGDIRLNRYVDSALVDLSAVFEEASFGVAGYVPEESLRRAGA